MHYLITGGAGFLGINLIRHLLDRGAQITSYDIAPFTYPERNRVRVLTGDIRNTALHADAMRGVDVVVHCAAALPLFAPSEIASTEIEGTRALLVSARAAGIDRFVHISSTAVYGVPDHHPIMETDPLVGVGPYGAAKIGAEAACESARAQGLCVPVLRPKSFVGPERLGVFELLYNFAADGHNFPVLGRGNNRYQLLDVADLCQAIELCATGPRAMVNDTFNVGAARFGSLREGFQAVLDRAGFGKRVVSLPAAPAIAALRLLEALHLSPVYKWVYATAATESFVSIEKITQTLGFAPIFSNEDALIRNFDWYLAHRDTIRAATGLTHRVAWKKGALSLARFIL